MAALRGRQSQQVWRSGLLLLALNAAFGFCLSDHTFSAAQNRLCTAPYSLTLCCLTRAAPTTKALLMTLPPVLQLSFVQLHAWPSLCLNLRGDA